MFERMNLHALPHQQAERCAIRLKVTPVHARQRPPFFRGAAQIESAVGIVHHGEGVRFGIEGDDPERRVAGLALHPPLGKFQACRRGADAAILQHPFRHGKPGGKHEQGESEKQRAHENPYEMVK